MLKMVEKFFDFCSKKNRNKFYKSIILGVMEAIFTNSCGFFCNQSCA